MNTVEISGCCLWFRSVDGNLRGVPAYTRFIATRILTELNYHRGVSRVYTYAHVDIDISHGCIPGHVEFHRISADIVTSQQRLAFRPVLYDHVKISTCVSLNNYYR